MQRKLTSQWKEIKRQTQRNLKNLFSFRPKRPGTPVFRQETPAPTSHRKLHTHRRRDARIPAAALILAAVLVMSILPTPISKNFTGWAKDVLSKDIELSGEFGLWDTFGEIRRVSGELIAPVLSGFVVGTGEENLLDDFSFPASGTVVPRFEIQGGGNLSGGILIESETAEILSTAPGTVKSIVKSEVFGSKVTVLHEGGFESTYDLVTEASVAVGDQVEGLSALGTCDRFFYFTLSKDGEFQDVSQLSDTRSV